MRVDLRLSTLADAARLARHKGYGDLARNLGVAETAINGLHLAPAPIGRHARPNDDRIALVPTTRGRAGI